MKVISGKGVCAGVAIGKARLMTEQGHSVIKKKKKNTTLEIERFNSAKQTCMNQLRELYETAVPKIGEANAQVFLIHQMMADDRDYCEAIESVITNQSVNAEYAVSVTGKNFAEMFSSMDDSYMQARAADVKDVSDRIINILMNVSEEESYGGKHIIVAEDLAPSQTVTLQKEKVLAFVTEGGSANSHTAIIARSLNIPAVINAEGILAEDLKDKTVIVDGNSGKVYIEPDEETMHIMVQKQDEEQVQRELLHQMKGKPSVTLDGRSVRLYANINGLKNAGEAITNDAEGIGLFRSEFIFLESDSMPDEEKQFEIYKKVLESMGERTVVVRTLDIGADKNIDYMNMKKEDNPAMGLRGIRLCLAYPEIMKSQLRALLRASVYGNLAIMFPMIISEEEVIEIREMTDDIIAEFKRNKIPFDENIEIGIMIETPAAAIISDRLAKLVDFFSIGTNDLTQYTLAVDRQNPALDRFLNPHHPAILSLIKQVCENAHRNNAWVGICGELGADTELTEEFLRYGVDELSVAPAQILRVRKKIRSIDLSKKQMGM